MPRGERKDDFSNRICSAFSALVDKALADGEELLVILAHGGTQMAAMERYALPRRDYYAWCGPNAGGYVLVGVVSFAAAAAITALCFRLRIRENQKKDGTGKPDPQKQEGKTT